MIIEPHNIEHEFPQHRSKLARLCQSDSEFAALVDRHDELDRSIHKIEERQQAVSDEEVEKLKYERSELKDRIWSRLESD
ncbi:YdcH family protein [Coraliomargarita parva]|uniref:YdcH family protein n=1 Tax=Coraliomargarita parva TaxID=3014050 RepID=UPI0022B32CD0|nr:DUF465 domain-containing protein [Coraliomargarita parva]